MNILDLSTFKSSLSIQPSHAICTLAYDRMKENTFISLQWKLSHYFLFIRALKKSKIERVKSQLNYSTIDIYVGRKDVSKNVVCVCFFFFFISSRYLNVVASIVVVVVLIVVGIVVVVVVVVCVKCKRMHTFIFVWSIRWLLVVGAVLVCTDPPNTS